MSNWRLFSRRRLRPPLSEPPPPPPGSVREILDNFLSPAVLWFLFGGFVATSGVMLGISLHTSTDDNTDSRSDPRWDSNFYNLVSQVLITILACYCTLIPVLHAHINGTVNLHVNVIVFYFSIVLGLCTAVVAPIVYVARPEKDWKNVSDTLNFVSSVSSVITASQLAAGVLKLGR